jgi:hypothetical protein
MAPRSLGPAIGFPLGFERAQFRLRLGKQHLDHGPLCRIGFRGE